MAALCSCVPVACSYGRRAAEGQSRRPMHHTHQPARCLHPHIVTRKRAFGYGRDPAHTPQPVSDKLTWIASWLKTFRIWSASQQSWNLARNSGKSTLWSPLASSSYSTASTCKAEKHEQVFSRISCAARARNRDAQAAAHAHDKVRCGLPSNVHRHVHCPDVHPVKHLGTTLGTWAVLQPGMASRWHTKPASTMIWHTTSHADPALPLPPFDS